MTSGFAQELEAARASGPEALQALAEKHLPLVSALTRRFPHPSLSTEDLYQQGVLGLMKALQRFDPSFGTTFSTYAAALILGEMRMLHRLNAPIHLPRTEAAFRRKMHQVEATLTSALGRAPTIIELADALHTDPADLLLHMEDITVVSADAPGSFDTPLSDIIPDPEDWQRKIELRDILSRLPEKDRRLILLRHRYGLTQTQAGQRLGMTQMQVSRRETIIRSLLRRALAE